MAVVEVRPPFTVLKGKVPAQTFAEVRTPAYVLSEAKLEENAQLLAHVMERTGCKILLAQKAFSNYDFYPLLSKYIAGTEASGLYEARLGWEEMPEGEVHVFCGAYSEEDFGELLSYADHIVFNSIHQLAKYGPAAKDAGKSLGLRVNPESSTQEGHAIYDPCAPGSRLGVTRAVWDKEMTEDLLDLLDGLHFHTLCEQNADDLETTLEALTEKFCDVLPRMEWLNMGGGHHITRPDYDLEKLEHCITRAQNLFGVEVYLEPGEAVALNAGYFLTKILDIVENGEEQIAILDGSAACHMPDVIEMPYLPPLYGAEPLEGPKRPHTYILGGPTCLSGDVIGTYTFQEELHVGDMLVFGDMAIYTTCKNNTFNGMPLPNIWRWTGEGELEQLTSFGYDDFKHRLGRSME